MNFFGGAFFETVRAKMSWAAQRQNVLARNIANASTPEFVPSDLKEKSFGAFLRQSASGGDAIQPVFKGSFGTRMGGRLLETSPDGETTPNGNGVNLERQMMKVAENAIEYQQAAGLYRKAVGMWRTALGGRGA